MTATTMRREEGIGLAVAIALHAAVMAALLIRPPQHPVVTPPQRIEVSIGDEVGMTSTSPDPFSAAAPDRGPEQGEPAPAPAPAPEPVREPEPLPPAPAPRAVERPEPKPQPRPEPRPEPKPQPKPEPRPQPKPAKQPAPKPATKPSPAPSAKPKPATRGSSAIDNIVSKPSSKPSSTAKSGASSSSSSSSSKSTTPPKKAGSSSFADAFSDGVAGAKADTGKGTPAAQIGAQARSALSAAITRQLKPHWQAPQGAEADLLVTRLRFRLNRDGSLAGEPEVISTTGQTPANQAQVRRHQEQAVRAVKLASPFNLPEDLYEGWKVITTNFDKRLSQ